MLINNIEFFAVVLSFALVLSYQFPRLGRIALLRPPLALGMCGFGIVFGQHMVSLIAILPILVWLVQIWRVRRTMSHLVLVQGGDAESLADHTQADAIASMQWLKRHMVKRQLPAGTVIFRKGDLADAMYLVVKGEVRIDEINLIIGAGELIGEMGIFSPSGVRTATAICQTDCELLYLSAKAALQQFTLDSDFALRIVRMIIARMMHRLARMDARKN
ncbi:MAG: cyclic nucleotide-binding domain-containing protein [Alphaproteobacteria bacterium]|nr:cyclic nucleotide-binding domain-containing protein [Alphaproteobacteria bacterium]